MSVVAKLQYLRIAPRKVRLVADLIRGKTVEEAQMILNFTTKKAVQPLFKLLKSAVSNAKHNFQLEETNLYVSKITVDEGPKYKRWMPRARGQASEIQKKTSHITIILDEIEKKPKKIKKLKKPEEIKKPEEKISKPKKSKPKPEIEKTKPKPGKRIKRIFKRKAF
jgi:large subunit ribosomal protein L22